MYPTDYRHEDDTSCLVCGEETMTIGFSLGHRCSSEPGPEVQLSRVPEPNTRSSPVKFFSPGLGTTPDLEPVFNTPKPRLRKTESRASVTHLWSGKRVREAPSWKNIPLDDPPWELAECGTLGSGMSLDFDEVNCKNCKRTAVWKNSKSCPNPLPRRQKP